MPPQNIYDNDDFYCGYIQIPRQKQGLDGAPEWPSIQALLPNLRGKRVIDLGCGFGYFSRYAREKDAATVLGIDISKNMISVAEERTSDADIEYRIADLDVLELPNAAFDFAYSALTFHYLENFARLVRTVYQSLTPGSYFVFEIEHPIFMAATKTAWIEDESGKRSWPVNSYSIEGVRTTDWFTKGVRKYHRTMATTINTLITAGFTIRQVVEYAPTAEDIEADPRLAPERDRPMFLIISAQR